MCIYLRRFLVDIFFHAFKNVIQKSFYWILALFYIIKKIKINYVLYSQLPISRSRKGPRKVSDLARCPTNPKFRISCKYKYIVLICYSLICICKIYSF